ncbi:MAG: hypothetical protein ACR2MS_07915 [Weeksellaceae bacterium]
MIEKLADDIANKFLQNNTIDLNGEVFKVAKLHKLSSFQVDRLANSANKKVIISIQSKIPEGMDPHFCFPTVDAASIVSKLKNEPDYVASAKLPEQKTVIVEKNVSDPEDTIMSVINNPSVTKDKGVGLMALDFLKMRAEAAISKLMRVKMMIESKKEEIQKQAGQLLISGHPIEPLQAVDNFGLISKVASLIEQNGQKINHTEEEFEVDETHPIVQNIMEMRKLAFDYAEIASEVEEIKSQIKNVKSSEVFKWES